MERQVYACLSLFILQFITLMFYLELFELNFLGLNKNPEEIFKKENEKRCLNKKEIKIQLKEQVLVVM